MEAVQLKLLEEELRSTRELARSREEGQVEGQEVERLRAQEQYRAAQEQNRAAQEKEGVGKEEEAREKGPEHQTVKLKVLATYQSIPSTPPSSLRILLSS